MATIGSLQGFYPAASPLAKQPDISANKSEKAFGDLLQESIQKVEQKHMAAENALENLLTGKSDNLHQTMIAMEKASISLELMLQVRNKIIAAYDEIKRMQI
jgi:flagellar hook-basal body complex protein FliE